MILTQFISQCQEPEQTHNTEQAQIDKVFLVVTLFILNTIREQLIITIIKESKREKRDQLVRNTRLLIIRSFFSIAILIVYLGK